MADLNRVDSFSSGSSSSLPSFSFTEEGFAQMVSFFLAQLAARDAQIAELSSLFGSSSHDSRLPSHSREHSRSFENPRDTNPLALSLERGESPQTSCATEDLPSNTKLNRLKRDMRSLRRRMARVEAIIGDNLSGIEEREAKNSFGEDEDPRPSTDSVASLSEGSQVSDGEDASCASGEYTDTTASCSFEVESSCSTSPSFPVCESFDNMDQQAWLADWCIIDNEPGLPTVYEFESYRALEASSMLHLRLSDGSIRFSIEGAEWYDLPGYSDKYCYIWDGFHRCCDILAIANPMHQ